MIQTIIKPDTASEAATLMQKHGSEACYFGGGTLINNPSMAIDCQTAIDLSRLGLDRIDARDDNLRIGARVTFQALIDTADVPAALKQAAASMASRQTRNMATIGGNVAARRSDSYLLPCLTALGARVETAEKGELGIETYLADREQGLIMHIDLPKTAAVCATRRFERQAGGPAVMSAAVGLTLNNGQVQSAVVAMGGVSPGAVRLPQTEKQLSDGTTKTAEAIAQAVAREVAPIDDLLGSVEFKKHIAGVLVADCVRACMQEEA